MTVGRAYDSDDSDDSDEPARSLVNRVVSVTISGLTVDGLLMKGDCWVLVEVVARIFFQHRSLADVLVALRTLTKTGVRTLQPAELQAVVRHYRLAPHALRSLQVVRARQFDGCLQRLRNMFLSRQKAAATAAAEGAAATAAQEGAADVNRILLRNSALQAACRQLPVARRGEVARAEGGEVSVVGGGEVSIAGGGEVSIAGGGEVAKTGGGKESRAEGGEVARAGGGEVARTGGGEVSIAGGGEESRAGGVEESRAGGGKEFKAGGGEESRGAGGGEELEAEGGGPGSATERPAAALDLSVAGKRLVDSDEGAKRQRVG